MSRLIFTIVFGLLFVTSYAGKPKSYYFVGVWNGEAVQINNPNIVGKNKYCVLLVRVNGQKIKTKYKIGGIEFYPSDYGFSENQELIIEITSRDDCEPTFHSEGFVLQL